MATPEQIKHARMFVMEGDAGTVDSHLGTMIDSLSSEDRTNLFDEVRTFRLPKLQGELTVASGVKQDTMTSLDDFLTTADSNIAGLEAQIEELESL